MATQTIKIVEIGKGPQLSTSRVTVQDLVPYFQEGCPDEEIIRWIPTRSVEEIAIVRDCYREHQQQLDAEDKLIRQRSALRRNTARVESVLKKAREERLAITRRLRQHGNGDSN